MEQIINDYHLSEKLEELTQGRSDGLDSSDESEVSSGSNEDNDGTHEEASIDLEENEEECNEKESCESTDNDSDNEEDKEMKRNAMKKRAVRAQIMIVITKKIKK
uniref:Uncharacterized protein n=1 Tax=Cacopsylla melanoneura TaxID=428564 RepID=A0A8D8WH22_9HEMI